MSKLQMFSLKVTRASFFFYRKSTTSLSRLVENFTTDCRALINAYYSIQGKYIAPLRTTAASSSLRYLEDIISLLLSHFAAILQLLCFLLASVYTRHPLVRFVHIFSSINFRMVARTCFKSSSCAVTNTLQQ
jgi:hypothetical protein